MKFALVGRNISHSRSPVIYRKLIPENLEYDLIDVSETSALPSLSDLARKYNGINITSPYKQHYISQVTIEDPEVRQLQAINTIALTPSGFFATNTDLIAVREILKKFLQTDSQLHLVILGHGVMGRLTEIVAKGLGISFKSLERKTGLTPHTDLHPYIVSTKMNIVINACAREFVFEGDLPRSVFFWDYNYNFLPHQNTLPFKVNSYIDGQEMLWLQAQAAVKFWNTTNAKLKC